MVIRGKQLPQSINYSYRISAAKFEFDVLDVCGELCPSCCPARPKFPFCEQTNKPKRTSGDAGVNARPWLVVVFFKFVFHRFSGF